MTARTWLEGIAALEVTGVKRKWSSMPPQLNDADLPLSFPRLPEAEQGVVALSGATGLTTRQMEWVFVVRPFSLSTNKAEFEKALDLIDAIASELSDAAIAQSVETWVIRWGEESFDGGVTGYRVLVVTVTGSE
jgi:hypothetical protein